VARNVGAQPDLWKFGISGDFPIILVTIADAGELAVAQELIRCQEFLRARGLKVELVILNEIPTSYRQDAQDDLQRMAEAGPSHSWIDRPGGVFLRRGDGMSEQDRILLRAVARAILDGVRGGLEAQSKQPLIPPPPPLLEVSARKPWRAIFQSLSAAPAPPLLPKKADAALQFFNGLADSPRTAANITSPASRRTLVECRREPALRVRRHGVWPRLHVVREQL
jgi:cellobiose phosphorylase